jgi:hypothetical protein
MSSFRFYTDSLLTQPITSFFEVGEGIRDFQFYLGSTNSNVRLQDSTSPGVNSMEIEVADSSPGTNAEVSWVKLSLSYSNLSSANAGDPLDIGTTIYGGVVNAVPFWVRITNSLSGVSSSTELSLKLTSVKEFSI